MSEELPPGRPDGADSGPESTKPRKKRRRGRRRRKNAAAHKSASTSDTARAESGAETSSAPDIAASIEEAGVREAGKIRRKPWFRRRRGPRRTTASEAIVTRDSNGKRLTRRPGRGASHVPDEPVSAALEEKSAEARRLARTKNPENLPGRKKNAKTRERQRSAAPEQSKPYAYAALDLGTNNCRLLIAIPGMEGEFRVVGSFSRIVRLGDGLEHTGRLREDAMDRAVEALAVCAERLDDRRIKRVRLIATEACRRASNGEAFLQRVEEETGIKLEIVNRETEARLAVSGCGSLVDPKAKGAVLFDIGGGSSEVALLDFRQKRHRKLSENIVEWTSLPVGVVTLADRFGGKDVTRESYAEMVAAVEEMIAEFAGQNALKDLHDGPDFHLLGTSGTVTTLAGIHLKLERYDRRRVDGVWMSDLQLDAMIDELLEMDFVQRQQNPCIGVDRADLVLAGCAILDAIRNTWPAKRLRVADRGLREGLLMEMMHEDVAWRKKPHKQGQRYHGRGAGGRNDTQRHRSASRKAETVGSGKKPGQQR